MSGRAAEAASEDAGFLLNTIMGFWLAPSLAVAARLKLPDIVADGPLTAPDISARTGTDELAVARLLNALASVGIFERLPGGRYGPTGRSDLLRDEHPSRLGHLIDIGMAGENLAAWSSLEAAIRQGKCAFDLRHGVHWIEYLRDRPERRSQFDAAMMATTRASEQAVLEGHDFGAFERVIDIGGSHASLIGALLSRHPHARGVVFDLPEAIETGKASWRDSAFAPRLEAVGGDFFESAPDGDLYLLKLILHDWGDADAIAILKTIRRAIRPNGRIAIIETILPADGSPHMGWGLDIVMMVTTGGRERSADEHRMLLEAAGFAVVGLSPTASMYSVLEARAV